MTEWHLAMGGQSHGPYDEPTVRQWQAAGGLPAETMVWAAHLPDWQPIESIFGPAPPSTAAPAPPQATPLAPAPPHQASPPQASSLWAPPQQASPEWAPPGTPPYAAAPAWTAAAQQPVVGAATTWPPPTRAYPYSPSGLHVLGRWAQGLLFATGALFAITGLVGLNAWRVYGDFVAGTTTTTASMSADDGYWGMVGLSYVVMFATAVVFIVWMYRYWGQLVAVKGTASRHGRGWTIGGWVVPVANLWIPKQMMDDYWRHTGTSAPRGLKEPVSPLLHLWWAAWLVGAVLQQVSGAMEPGDEGSWHAFYLVTVSSDAIWAVAAVLVAVIVGRLVTRLSRLSGHRS